MKISFHGAAREVTGSCHLLEAAGATILLDCGMIQGGKERHERNREPFPFPANEIDAVVLSHAHIDHSGRLPLLIKAGFKGPILATEATVDLCKILLTDSAHIHEEDARWKIKRLRKKGEDANWVRPLFTKDEALAVIERFVPLPFDQPHEVNECATLRFVKAGHILGAAIVELDVGPPGARQRIAFSGDLGVEGARLLSRPAQIECPQYLLLESTYGDRRRHETEDRTELLYEIVQRTVGRGGKVVIPSFAVGRTQEILARLNDLVETGRLSGLKVYVDSPMAVAATRVFENHPDAFSPEARRQLHAGDEPLDFKGLTLIKDVRDSIELNHSREPAVIISASGMCTAGRIKHHLKHNIGDSRNTVVFVGYQAHGSLGKIIQSGVSPIRIFGEWYPVGAAIETIEGFSAHADLDELLGWFGRLGGLPRRVYLVHGEEAASLNLAAMLRKQFGAEVRVPRLGESDTL